MKFQLKPYNRGLTDEALLEDLRCVAKKLGKDYVTKEEYDQIGRLCASTLQKRLGSWCKAEYGAGVLPFSFSAAPFADIARSGRRQPRALIFQLTRKRRRKMQG